MTFDSPGALIGLLVLVPLFLLQLRGFRKGRADIEILGRSLNRQAAQTLFVVKWFFSVLTFDLFIAFSVLALADVTWGEQPVEEDRENLDVVVALDISRSMLADDVEPTRLARSLSVIRSIARQLPSARFGLVVFKGDAGVLLPLTADLNALEAVLDGVRPELISTPGTDVEKGLIRAVEAFPEGTNAHRAIVLFSDGESLSGSPTRAAARARSLGIPVLTVITGTVEGAALAAADGSAIVDDQGRPVISRATPAPLEELARMTGGRAVWLDDLDVVDLVVETAVGHVLRREETGYRLVPVSRYPLFIGAALIALAASIAVRVFRWRDMF